MELQEISKLYYQIENPNYSQQLGFLNGLRNLLDGEHLDKETREIIIKAIYSLECNMGFRFGLKRRLKLILMFPKSFVLVIREKIKAIKYG